MTTSPSQDKHPRKPGGAPPDPVSLPANLNVPTLGNRLFAGFDQRLSATLIDLLAILFLYLLVGFLLAIFSRATGLLDALPTWGELLAELYLPALAYGIIAIRLFGATAGKRFLGIQVLRSDGSGVGWVRAMLRELIRLSPLLPVVVVMAAFRRDSRGLHDLIADTVVVRAAPGIPATRIE